MRPSRILAAAVLALSTLVGGSAALSDDWADNKDDWASGPQYEPSKALCRKLKTLTIPAADRPTPVQAAGLKSCSSEDLYYGLGRAADPVKARQCAILELEEGRADSAFSGGTMLMTVYANGRGAARNLDLAIHYACGLEDGPDEMHARIDGLAEHKAKGWQGQDFDYCDDAQNTIAMGYCAYHNAAIANEKRGGGIASLAAAWTPAERQALGSLTAAKAAWVKAIDAEVDTSGSGRALFLMEAEQGEEEAFFSLLKAIAAGKIPAATPGQLKAADAELNRVYGLVMRTGDEEDWGSVKKSDIKETQRTWLKYRDAWIAFARVKAPGVSAEAVNTWLTRKRTESLKGFLPG